MNEYEEFLENGGQYRDSKGVIWHSQGAKVARKIAAAFEKQKANPDNHSDIVPDGNGAQCKTCRATTTNGLSWHLATGGYSTRCSCLHD